MINIFGSPLLRQYAVVIIANLTAFATGLTLGWSSPVLVKLRDANETVLSEPISDQQGSWIVSLPFLSGILSDLIVGYLLDSLGRKCCLIMSCVPRILISVMFLFAKEAWVILLGRLLSGLLDPLAFIGVATYVSEIANKEVRGSLGTLLQISCSAGILLTLGIGPFVSYITLNTIHVCALIVCSVPLLFLPDSPYFLYSKGKTEDSRKILVKLRGSDLLATEEIKAYQIASSEKGHVKVGELMRNRLFLKAAGICVVLGTISQASGYTAVIFYLQTIFEATNTSVTPEISSVIIGSMQLFASFCTALFSDRFGRKTILISTIVGVALGCIGLGAFFKITEDQIQIKGFMNYIPLISMILIVLCHSAGIASVNWVLSSELFEGRTRAMGASIGMLTTAIVGFTVTKTMPLLTASIGPSMTYWLFGIICVLFCMFTMFFIPETKGRSFEEIQNILGKNGHNAGKYNNDIEQK